MYSVDLVEILSFETIIFFYMKTNYFIFYPHVEAHVKFSIIPHPSKIVRSDSIKLDVPIKRTVREQIVRQNLHESTLSTDDFLFGQVSP